MPAVEICCDRSAAGIAEGWQKKRVDDSDKHFVSVFYAGFKKTWLGYLKRRGKKGDEHEMR